MCFRLIIPFVFYVSCIFISLVTGATAAPYCPSKIASIETNQLNTHIGPIMQGVYEKLGCKIEYIPLPGRRGILSFNEGDVDGELFRLQIIEAKYDRSFIRSEIPIVNLSLSLWTRPDMHFEEQPPIAYTIGVVWQEEYIQDKVNKRFLNNEELFDAFNAGIIDAFLTSDVELRDAYNHGDLNILPTRVKVVQNGFLFHYLGDEYLPFMQDLSDEIEKNDPFKNAMETIN